MAEIILPLATQAGMAGVGMNFSIRPVGPADIEHIVTLARRIWRQTYPGIIRREQIEYMLEQRYNPTRILAELTTDLLWWDQLTVADALVGFVSSMITPDGEMKIDKLYIDPQWQRMGLGRRLLEVVANRARLANRQTMILAVNKHNERAIAAYLRYGFVIREAVCVDIGAGFVMDDFIMAKSLTSCSPLPLAMRLSFTKMHGLGNDFIVLDGIRQTISLTPEQLRHLANRHFGIGCDQILVVESSSQPEVDFRYRIFNADGNEVEQCGNGARCFVRFVHEGALTTKREIRVETMSGIIVPRLEENGMVSVDMGVPQFDPVDIPFVAEEEGTEHPLSLGEEIVYIMAIGMGNPHAVQLVDDVDAAPVARQGPLIESHPRFPRRANAGFMQIVDRQTIRLRVYERGAGETLACGSGACAAVVAGIARKLLDSPVKVHMYGGALCIAWAGEGSSVWMTGPAVTVFKGEIEV